MKGKAGEGAPKFQQDAKMTVTIAYDIIVTSTLAKRYISIQHEGIWGFIVGSGAQQRHLASCDIGRYARPKE